MTNSATPRPTCIASDIEHFAYWCSEATRVRGSDPAAELEALSHAVDSGDPCRIDCDFLAIYTRLSHLLKEFPHLAHQYLRTERDELESAVSQAVADPHVPAETLRSLWRKLRQTGKPSDSLECHVTAAMGDNAALNQLMTELPAFESDTYSAHQHFMRVADYLDAYVDQPPQVSEVAKLLRFVGRRQALPPYYGFALIIELLAVLAAQLPWLVIHVCISVVQFLKLTKPQPWYFSLPQLTISGRVFAR
ncbi:MAG: hypothetical protein Q4D85_06895 [Corynebacterium sp.]|uniref:hypothetical protein n=1 Tax=Corynebacterium sp. TaxID=1720 RepID=UPI0026DAE4FD|nr:hypothetical protein [Corynebacterium sp.]MDO5098473.1 hypothetical protein [Corynebacterium sp.]